jgi:hypothetical protein
VSPLLNLLFVAWQMHTNYRPHKCSTCGKSFACVGELKVHFRIHSGDRPYPCDICARRFQSQGNMRKHRANIHKDAPPFFFPKVSAVSILGIDMCAIQKFFFYLFLFLFFFSFLSSGLITMIFFPKVVHNLCLERFGLATLKV